MTRRLQSGLYEELLTSALEAEIDARTAEGWWVDVGSADATVRPEFLARHVYQLLRRALEGIPEEDGTQSANQIALANRLVEVLFEHGAMVDDRVADAARLLLEAVERRVLGDTPAPVPRPTLSLRRTLDSKIDGLEKELRACARQDEDAARLMTIPGIGPISAMARQAFAPPMESFRRGRDFSAWLGLVPRQHTTGGKPRLGRISKMGQRDLRRLLIIGAMAVVSSAVRRGETNDPWLARMLARKPRMLVAVALANKMARIVCDPPHR